ncbi:MAG: DUF501 domain-containing protein [Terriglobia bacterium]
MAKTSKPECSGSFEKQLGRRPRGEYLTVAICRIGRPVVIRTDPVADGCPFPTLYYLVCPSLVRGISQLEGTGGLATVRQMLAESPRLAASVQAAHEEYALERRLIMRGRVGGLTGRGLQTVCLSGVGGVRNTRQISCLHAHAAHFLAGRSNPVGRHVTEALRSGGRGRCSGEPGQLAPAAS